MKKIITAMALTMIMGIDALALGALPESSGNLECQTIDGQFNIQVIQEVSAYLNQSGDAELAIMDTGGEVLAVLHGKVQSMSTRAGAYYSYQFPIQDVGLHLSEFTKTVVSPPGCQQQHSRITCDYKFVTTLTGALTLNGKVHNVSCK